MLLKTYRDANSAANIKFREKAFGDKDFLTVRSIYKSEVISQFY